MTTNRRIRIDNAGALCQVRYWDPIVEVWCDYGDPVPVDQVDDKSARCREGLAP